MIVFTHSEYRDHFIKVMRAAAMAGIESHLRERIQYLGSYAYFGNGGSEHRTRCRLFDDRWSPFSFEFCMELWDPEQQLWVRWFNGGLNYHGPTRHIFAEVVDGELVNSKPVEWEIPRDAVCGHGVHRYGLLWSVNT